MESPKLISAESLALTTKSFRTGIWTLSLPSLVKTCLSVVLSPSSKKSGTSSMEIYFTLSVFLISALEATSALASKVVTPRAKSKVLSLMRKSSMVRPVILPREVSKERFTLTTLSLASVMPIALQSRSISTLPSLKSIFVT